MELDKLRVFYEVVKAGSITRAADALNITQPALSRSIKLLEHSVKTKLLERLPRGIKLTPNGETLFECACKIMNEYASATRFIAQDKSDVVSGPLKIITSHTLAASWLVHYVGEFIEKFPEVSLDIECDNNFLYPGITEASLGGFLPQRPDLIQIYIKTFYTKLFASKAYLEKFGAPESVDDLDDHRILISGANNSMNEGNQSISDWLMQLGSSRYEARKPYIKINSMHALFNAARDGLGIIALGKDHPRLEKCDDLVEVLPNFDGPASDLYYIYPTQMQNLKAVVEFGNYLQQKFNLNNAKIKNEFIERNKFSSNNVLQFSRIA